MARENIWAIMQEPYMKGFNDWMVEKHEHISKVFTHYVLRNDKKYIPSHPALPWHINKTFDELISAKVPVKSKKLSAIVGDAMDLPGHMQSRNFLQYIQNDTLLELDLYGKKINFIEDRWGGLVPYKYSLAMENSGGPDYWTDKIADCFLSWMYQPGGLFSERIICQNRHRTAGKSLAKIGRIVNEDNWEKYIPALEDARNLILNGYQLFPYLSEIIQSQPEETSDKISVTIPPYKRSKKATFYHVVYKLKKRWGYYKVINVNYG